MSREHLEKINRPFYFERLENIKNMLRQRQGKYISINGLYEYTCHYIDVI